MPRRTPARSSPSGHCPPPYRKARGLDTEEKGKPSRGARDAQYTLHPTERLLQSAGRGYQARRARRGQVHIAPFDRTAPSSAHSSGSTLRGGGASPAASPRAERSPCTPGRGASRHPLAPRAPASGAGAPPHCSPFLPPPLPPDPSPPGAPRLPSPTPAPWPGLSTTSLRSWRPHVFTRLAALVDVVSRSDFQARPQLRRQHQPGPTRAPRSCARGRRRARVLPLSRPPRPGPAQPQPKAQRAQPCHPQQKAAPAARTSASAGAGSRRGSCRHPLPFSRRRRREPWPPPPACRRSPEHPQDCELAVPLTCGAGLCAPALGPDGCTGWDLGLLELMSNWGSAETRSEVSGKAGRGGGGGWCLRRWRAQRAACRWRHLGCGWTPEQAGKLERKKTRGNQGPEKTEEREQLSRREAGLAEGRVAFPRGQRSLVPPLSPDPGMDEGAVFLPDLTGRSSVNSRGCTGLGSSLHPPRPERSLSGHAAA